MENSVEKKIETIMTDAGFNRGPGENGHYVLAPINQTDSVNPHERAELVAGQKGDFRLVIDALDRAGIKYEDVGEALIVY